MKVLFVASECAPFVKTGGLADVVGALPRALSELGAEVRVLMPLYPALKSHSKRARPVLDLGHLHGGKARIVAERAEGLDLLLLDAPHLYDRPGNPYLGADGKDWPDNAFRFGALGQAAAQVTREGANGWRPDILHAHDWQAGLAPVYLRQKGDARPCIMTIHNIAFQGNFPATVAAPLGLDPSGFTRDGYEFWGQVGFLKAGIAHANRITTVSPTYARELMRPEFGMGLEGLLEYRKRDLFGILNGIDLDAWNPATDPAARPYTARSLARKAENRAALAARFGLEDSGTGPLFCVISRLTAQKGLDLLIDVLPGLVSRGARLAVLGSGEAALEAAFRKASTDFRGAVGVILGYDEPLSHLVQAGADSIIVPSRFEPCGLTQLYGLRYGTLPLVARTGGLADTVIDANEAALATGCATGFQFAPVTAAALGQAIDRACDLFSDRPEWERAMRNAMRHPVGWDRSAAEYMRLFAGLLDVG